MDDYYPAQSIHNVELADPVIMPWAERHGLTWFVRDRDYAIRKIVIPETAHALTFVFGISEVRGETVDYGYALSMSRGRFYSKQDTCALGELESRLDYILEHHLDEDFTAHMTLAETASLADKTPSYLDRIIGFFNRTLGIGRHA